MRMAKICRILLLLCVGIGKIAATEEWWEYGHFYQIYPRSFQDSDGDGVGDLQGIASRLPHLKYINVSAIWLSPIFESPLKDFGYDISNFRRIHWEYGDMYDFDNLVVRCKNLGIKLILDFVPNHCSDQHEWFKKAINITDPDHNKYKHYFIWNKGKPSADGTRAPPSNWLSIFRGSAWEWVPSVQEFYYHLFMNAQPDLNYRNEAVLEEMKEVLRYWLRKGVDGFRIDAVPHLFEVDRNADGFYDDEPLSGECAQDPDAHCHLSHAKTMDLDETYDLIYQWRQVMEEPEFADHPRILMTEAYTTVPKAVRYYGKVDNGRITQYGAQIPFNFELIAKTDMWTSAYDFKAHIEEWINNMPKGKGVHANWVLGNHDNKRMATKFGPNRIDIFNILIKTLPGVTVTYYGEEIGMTDVDVPPQRFTEVNPQQFDDYPRFRARTPLQWDDSKNAGFSTAEQTWLPVATNYTINNAKLQKMRSASYVNNFQRLIKLRQNPTMKYGTFKITAIDSNLLAYKRELEGQPKTDIFAVVLNLGSHPQYVDLRYFLDGLPPTMSVVVTSVNTTGAAIGDIIETKRVYVPPEVGIVLVERKP